MELKCFVVHATLTKRGEINRDLQIYEVGNGKYYKYISFCYTLLDIKLAHLYIKNANNVEIRYEYLENTNINDIVEYNRNIG